MNVQNPPVFGLWETVVFWKAKCVALVWKGWRMKKRDAFMIGLFCGVILALVSMGIMIFRLQVKIRKNLEARIEVQQGMDSEALKLDRQQIGDKMLEIENLVNRYYLNEVDPQEVQDLIYEGMLVGLNDPYSVYYTRENLDAINESTAGIYEGIGVTLSQSADTKEITVISCFPDTPAFEAGILPGDIVWKFKGEEIGTMDLSMLVSQIKRGEEKEVSLGLLRDGEEVDVEVEKSDIQIPTVKGEMLEDRIGYLQVLEFDQVTYQQFKDELEKLDQEGADRVIIDLRNNPGGVLSTVCDMLDLILPEGRIVYTEDKYGNKVEHFSDEENQYHKPMVVLINENSASASEIFAGAIKDFEWGTLVGTTTFGKGIVQRIFPLSDGTGIKLTISKYYTGKGHDIHEIGIEPDVVVELDSSLKEKALIPMEEDNQIQEAIKILKTK